MKWLEGLSKKQRTNLQRIIAAALLLLIIAWLPLTGLPRFLAYAIPYLIVGYDVLCKAWKGIVNRQPLDENLLMAIATLGAMALAIYEDGDYTEGIAVMLFYQIGELFQSCAVSKSRRDITALMDIRPDYANIEGADGQLVQVDPDEVEVGSLIVVQPGEKIPLDGVIAAGRSTLNTAALTGESLPREVSEGEEVVSGSVNLTGLLKIRTTKEFDESTASKILELVSEASSRKSKSEAFITRFARIYTPAVVSAAAVLALLPPLANLGLGEVANWGTWLYRALVFLVISCPCALVISIPLTFFAGLGGASRTGVLVKGSNYLEALAKVDTVVFDKTGTLTRGVFEVTAVHPQTLDRQELLHLAAHVERYSKHPIAASLRAAYPHEADDCQVEAIQEIAGQGIKAQVNGHTVHLGNSKLMAAIGADWHECSHHLTGTTLHLALDGEYEGHVVISDVLKDTAKEAIQALHDSGIKETVMLTGDSKAVADKVASELGLSRVYSELLPADKVTQVEAILEDKKKSHQKGKVAFAGDGINDAPVLSRADVGIAMGALGYDAAIEAADVVLMDDDPLKISQAIRLSRRTLSIVKQNTWGAIGIKLLFLLLGALGLSGMWGAIFADVGVTIIAVLNATRALMVEKTSLKASALTA